MGGGVWERAHGELGHVERGDDGCIVVDLFVVAVVREVLLRIEVW